MSVAELTEKEWAAQVAEIARLTGWRRYHTYRSERSEAGFPDEVLVRDRIIYLELKSETGRVSPAQRDWLSALRSGGGEAYVARPHDLQELGHIFHARTRPAGGALDVSTQEELGQPP